MIFKIVKVCEKNFQKRNGNKRLTSLLMMFVPMGDVLLKQ